MWKYNLIFTYCEYIITHITWIKGEDIIKLSDEYVVAIRRKRGELNLSVIDLAKKTSISRWTLDKILAGKSKNIQPTTKEKLDKWLLKNI